LFVYIRGSNIKFEEDGHFVVGKKIAELKPQAEVRKVWTKPMEKLQRDDQVLHDHVKRLMTPF
jgi:hypothetical protein